MTHILGCWQLPVHKVFWCCIQTLAKIQYAISRRTCSIQLLQRNAGCTAAICRLPSAFLAISSASDWFWDSHSLCNSGEMQDNTLTHRPIFMTGCINNETTLWNCWTHVIWTYVIWTSRSWTLHSQQNYFGCRANREWAMSGITFTIWCWRYRIWTGLCSPLTSIIIQHVDNESMWTIWAEKSSEHWKVCMHSKAFSSYKMQAAPQEFNTLNTLEVWNSTVCFSACLCMIEMY